MRREITQRQSARSSYRGLLRGDRGVELLEFALVLPFLLILVVGIVDFGMAWVVKDKLSVAARDGARVAVAQFNDSSNPSTQCGGTTPCSVQTAANFIVEALQDTGIVNVCGLQNANSLTPSTSAYVWTYAAPCANSFTITIERAVPQLINSTQVLCTRVTIVYQYNWDFANVYGFFASASWLGGGGGTFANTFNITSQSIMANLN